MSVLSVNLKHLYQRIGLWLTYLILGLLVFSSLAIALEKPLAARGRFMGLVMLQFLIGACIASLSSEVLTKPFSYCLPGHRAVPRKFIFSVAAVTSLLGSLLFLAYPGLYWWQQPLVTCSAFCAGLIVFWAAVAFTFGVGNSGWGVVFASMIFCGAVFSDLHAAAERAIVGAPLAVISLGLVSSVVVWIWLGKSNWARKFCAVSRIGFFDLGDRDRVQEFARRRAAARPDKFKNHPSPWVERFFLDRMNNCDHLGPGRYIWGGLYTTYGMALSNWRGSLFGLIIWLAMMICFSYILNEGADILFFMGGVVVIHMRLPVYSSMTIPGGRGERFSTAVILAGSVTLLITAVLALVAAVSVALAPVMPDITFSDEVLTFHGTSLRLLIVPSMIIPIFLFLPVNTPSNPKMASIIQRFGLTTRFISRITVSMIL